MSAFRTLLIVMWVVVMAYTAVVVANHGMGLLGIFFGDIATMTWPGQFNLDFLCMLTLSGLWVAWRHRFSPAGMGLGVLALFGGIVFLSTYLLVVSWRTDADIEQILLGRRVAG